MNESDLCFNRCTRFYSLFFILYKVRSNKCVFSISSDQTFLYPSFAANSLYAESVVTEKSLSQAE